MPPPLNLLRIPAILLSACLLNGQTVDIADWQGNASGAVSMTFDDALDGHWSHADPILTAAGVRGTFFVITGSVDWDGARAAALNGHEIGSHSTDTTAYNTLTVAEAASRMQSSHDAIETQIAAAIPGYQCHSIAWPSGQRKLEVINDPTYHNLYLSARSAGTAVGTDNQYNPNPANTAGWWKYGEGVYAMDHWFVVGNATMTAGTSLAAFNGQLDLSETKNAWTVFVYHGIETGGYENISAANFTDQVAALAARSDSLYIAPYGEITRYIRERDDATAAVVSNDGTTITLSLTDTLNDAIFNIPLTLMLDAPAGWDGAAALQGGSEINAWIENGKILVNAVPDAGLITIEAVSAPAIVAPVLQVLPSTGNSLLLRWNSSSGQQYEIKQSTHLGGWTSLDPARIISGDGSIKEEEVTFASPRQFFILDVSVP